MQPNIDHRPDSRWSRFGAVITLIGTIASLVTAAAAIFIWSTGVVDRYITDKITDRTRFYERYFAGSAVLDNGEPYDAIRYLDEAFSIGKMRQLQWLEMTPVVDRYLSAINDSGESHDFATNYRDLKEYIGPHAEEHGWYMLQFGLAELLIHDDPAASLKHLEKAIVKYRKDELYRDSSWAYRGRALANIAVGDVQEAANDLISAAICNPRDLGVSQQYEDKTAFLHERWIGGFFKADATRHPRWSDAIELAQSAYADVSSRFQNDCSQIKP